MTREETQLVAAVVQENARLRAALTEVAKIVRELGKAYPGSRGERILTLVNISHVGGIA